METSRNLVANAEQFFNAGALDKTETLCRKVLAREKHNEEALILLGLVAYQSGKKEQAKRLFIHSISLSPYNPDLHYRLGNIYFDLGELEHAITSYKRALSFNPRHFPSLTNLSNTLLKCRRFEDAEIVSLMALDEVETSTEALSNLSQAYNKLGKYSKSLDVLEKCISYSPENTEFLTNLGVVQQITGDVIAAVDTYGKALAINPHCRLAKRNLQIAVLNLPSWNDKKLAHLHKRVVKKTSLAKNWSAPTKQQQSQNEILRIGYLGSDFFDHPVGMNILPIIRNYNKSAFSVHLYSCTENFDQYTREFKSLVDGWSDIGHLNDAQIAQKIINDRIDIMVYLAGRFNLNRPEVSKFRPAPVQVSFHDVATTGQREINYWLTDEDLTPNGTGEWFSEELYRLPNFYQFILRDTLPKIAPPPFQANGYITFGSFNKLEKLNTEVIKTWSEILRSVPHSKLLLKYSNIFSDKRIKTNWFSKFSDYEIDKNRLIFIGSDDTPADHLALYSQVDIALDPFPFNGATTTFESLLMGVPVISLIGTRFVERVSATILKQIGIGELRAKSPLEYRSIAQKLAKNALRMHYYRDNLRDLLLKSSLLDATSYTDSVENAYKQMWYKYLCPENK